MARTRWTSSRRDRSTTTPGIDTTLSTALFSLPGSVVANPHAGTNPASLAQRNLLRHLSFSLPSGQRVATAMHLPVLAKHDLDDLQ